MTDGANATASEYATTTAAMAADAANVEMRFRTPMIVSVVRLLSLAAADNSSRAFGQEKIKNHQNEDRKSLYKNSPMLKNIFMVETVSIYLFFAVGIVVLQTGDFEPFVLCFQSHK